MKCLKGMRALLWLALGLLTAACANMGRPEGGARDELPPRFMRSDPMPGSTGVNRTLSLIHISEPTRL